MDNNQKLRNLISKEIKNILKESFFEVPDNMRSTTIGGLSAFDNATINSLQSINKDIDTILTKFRGVSHDFIDLSHDMDYAYAMKYSKIINNKFSKILKDIKELESLIDKEKQNVLNK